MATLIIPTTIEKLAADANTAFGEYAAIAGDVDISDYPTLRRLQIEHARWQGNTFPPGTDQSTSTLLHGIVEEACWELQEAVEQNAMDEVHDSLGDVLIYTIAVCTNLRLDFMTIAHDFDAGRLQHMEGMAGILNLFKAVGMLNHVIGKHNQRTRGYESAVKVREGATLAIEKLCEAVHWLAFGCDWEPTVILEEVLRRVTMRNWKNNAMTGDAAAP